jgi:hypothetical protein
MPFHLAFSHSNFGKRSNPTLYEVFDPDSSLRDRAEQRLARL